MNILQSGQNLQRLPSSFVFSEKTHIASQHNPKCQIEHQEGIRLSRHIVYSDRTVQYTALSTFGPLAEEKHSRICSSRLKKRHSVVGNWLLLKMPQKALEAFQMHA